MIDIEKIARAAEAATPGPWHSPGLGEVHCEDHRSVLDVYFPADNEQREQYVGNQADADFAALADPQTILKLIAVVRAAKAMTDLYDKLALVLPGSEPDALREALEALK